MSRVYNVLFLCTHNSARSVMAEALLNKLGAGRFKGFSAGSYPKTQPNPFALEQVAKLGFSADQFSSKSWDVFAAPGMPAMDIIITVCDNAAGEACPIWPGHPATAHWGFPDPSDTQGDDETKRHAFAATMNAIKRRIDLLVSLSDEKLAHLAQSDTLKRIHSDAATA
ncbi:MAG: arsenate reductase ArsC [Burkholderiales bacterium]